MTQWQIYTIGCDCGNLIDFNLYQSVNVTVDKSLLKNVKERKINNYKCDKCGASSELAYQFLYVDMENKKWIWCYPEGEREKKSVIEQTLAKTSGLTGMLRKLGQPKPLLVFGYDELLNKLDLNTK